MIRVFIVTCILISLTFLVFSDTLNYEFLNWDDDVYVTANDRVKSGEDPWWWFLHTYYYSYIPITMLSHQADYAMFGGMAKGHHLANVLLHSFNTGWVFLVGVVLISSRKQLDGVIIAGMAAAALLFALHPLRAESVAWISDRKDLLCAFFLLPAILFYIEYRKQEGSRFVFLVITFVLFLLAVLSKSIAIGIPLVFLTIDWFLLSGDGWKKERWNLVYEKWPFIFVSSVLAIILLIIPSGGKQAYAVEQLQGAEVVLFPFYTVMFYLSKTVFPVDLSPVYPGIPLGSMIMSLILVVLVTVAVIAAASKGYKGSLAAWLIYLVFILPTIVGLSSGMQAQADRFSYLSTISVYLLFGGGITWALGRGSGLGRVLAGTGVTVAVLALASLTLRQIPIWQSSEQLWGYVYETFPPSRDYVDAYVNLGSDLAYQMKLPEAEEVLRTATRVDSTNADAFYNLAHVLYLQGEWETAAGLFLKSTEVDSNYADGYFNYAIVTSQLGRDEEAIPAMKKAASLGLESAKAALKQSGIPE
ncbi:MAG: tetratricopeptide repeat protein [Ignavibacteria bacterium]|nr:tetratricopeptide repeat protein [Ignavibacteria bacterium]